ncbi:MAG: hypothetical protein ACI9KE_001880, partial [Polyangiales bacterium]
MRYALLLWVVAGCAVDHAGLGSSEPPVSPRDAALLDGTRSDATPSDATPSDATPSDATSSDATLRDAGPSDASADCDGATSAGCEECPPGFDRDGAGECTDVDDCDPNPCMNEGSCADGIEAFTCTCPPSFTGATCETRAFDCDPNPCMNGGTCAE